MARHIVNGIDLGDPPVSAPDGCPNPVLWKLARDLFELHSRTPSGECMSCPRWRICTGHGLARDGLATALGMRVKESDYWLAYAQLMTSPKALASTGAPERRALS